MINDIKKSIYALSGCHYFENMSWLFAENILRFFGGIFVTIFVARYLGPEKLGILSYVVAFTGFFMAIAELGLTEVSIREFVKHPEKKKQYLGTVFWLKSFGSFIAVVLIFFMASFFVSDQNISYYIYVASLATLFSAFHVVDYYFQSLVLSKYMAISRSAQLFVSLIIKVYLVIAEAELIWFVVTIILDAILITVFYVAFYKWKEIDFSFLRRFNFKIAANLLKDSWPLILSGISAMIYLRIDQVMIMEYLNASELGMYAVAIKLVEPLYFIPAIIAGTFFPILIESKNKGENFYHNRLKKLYVVMIWLGIAIAIFTSITSEWLIIKLFGIEFAAAVSVLNIYTWSCVFVFLSSAYGKYLIIENLAKKNFYRVAVGAIINTVLNFFLIDLYGIEGAAISTLIALFVANFLYDLFDKDLRGQFIFKIEAIFKPIGIFL